MIKVLQYADLNIQVSKYLTVRDYVKSVTAAMHGIHNGLPIELLPNAKKIGVVFDAIYDNFKGNIILNSGYRGDKLNRKIGGSLRSEHSNALAIDIDGKNGVMNADIFKWVKNNLSFSTMIWEYGNRWQPDWVHIDLGEQRLNQKRLLKAYKHKGNIIYSNYV